MCGRYTLRTSPAELAEFLAITRLPDQPPQANICPTQQVLCAAKRKDTQQRDVTLMRWGWIPSNTNDSRPGAPLINARSETVAVKPTFRNAFLHQRCLIPADGFYEWKAEPGQKRKRPFHIRVASMPIMAFAGLWEQHKSTSRPPDPCCTILTTQANSAIAALHHRMPVILPVDQFEEWLSPDTSVERLQELLQPWPPDDMVLSDQLAEELLGNRQTNQRTLF